MPALRKPHRCERRHVSAIQRYRSYGGAYAEQADRLEAALNQIARAFGELRPLDTSEEAMAWEVRR